VNTLFFPRVQESILCSRQLQPTEYMTMRQTDPTMRDSALPTSLSTSQPKGSLMLICKKHLHNGIKIILSKSNCGRYKRRKKHEMVVVVTLTRAARDSNNRGCILAVGILVGGFQLRHRWCHQHKGYSKILSSMRVASPYSPSIRQINPEIRQNF
jgi:hypothetical protein